MTGWAQVHGLRGETAKTIEMQRRVEFDLWYIDHWSLTLECYILLRTVFSLVGRKVLLIHSCCALRRRGMTKGLSAASLTWIARH